jgi:hypothetical protein
MCRHVNEYNKNDTAFLWSADKEIATIGSFSTLLSDLVSDVLVALLCLTYNLTYK